MEQCKMRFVVEIGKLKEEQLKEAGELGHVGSYFFGYGRKL